MKRIMVFVLALVFACAIPAFAQTTPAPNPGTVSFTPSDDHAVIDSYVTGVFKTPSDAIPLSTTDLGKPVVAPDGSCYVSIVAPVRALPWGTSYIVRVKAVAARVWSRAGSSATSKHSEP